MGNWFDLFRGRRNPAVISSSATGATTMVAAAAEVPPEASTSPEDQDEAILKREIDEAFAGTGEKIQITRDENTAYCNLTYDFNPRHRDPAIARASTFIKFDDTPIVGTLLLAHGARIAQRGLENLRARWGITDQELFVVCYDIAFKNPAYPERDIEFRLDDHSESPSKGIEVKIKATDGNDQTLAVVSTVFHSAYEPRPTIDGPMFSMLYDTPQTELSFFYRITRDRERPEMPLVLRPSFIPSTLLQFLQDKTGSMEGGNLRMTVQYLSQPTLLSKPEDVVPGPTQIDIFPVLRKHGPVSEGNSRYTFPAIVSQDRRPLAYADIRCVAPKPLYLERKPLQRPEYARILEFPTVPSNSTSSNQP
jgi:acyl dehydratase